MNSYYTKPQLLVYEEIENSLNKPTVIYSDTRIDHPKNLYKTEYNINPNFEYSNLDQENHQHDICNDFG